VPKVVHFEIPADNIERALKFYREAFGWQMTAWSDPSMVYYLVTAGPDDEPGINGAIYPRPNPGVGIVNTIGVSSIDEYLERAVKAGAKVTLAKNHMPGVGWVAGLVDTEGNAFSLIQGEDGMGMG
jgi:uncharacterized protein